MNSKKAQAQIITTILIILLVLAAVVIVWQVVNKSIKQSSDQIEIAMDCVGLDITVSNVDVDVITVLRSPGNSNAEVKEVVLFINGVNLGTKEVVLGELDTTTLEPSIDGIGAYSLASGDKIKIGAILSNDAACSPSTEYTVA